ncbi:MAG: 3'(2'),5'-bisphosphate nucleotidase CysQ [Bacteroidia bacterium]|nr:3'(2'),5'-bisphosphate nucleotidase CysQ [Bacteroidia bacterium]
MNILPLWFDKAIEAGIKAGNAIMEVYQSDFAVESKEDKTPLTIADKKAHTIIENILPQDGIKFLSEEGKSIPYAERASWDLFWLIDPLDGTKEFIKRNGEFTVNIALIRQGEPIFGVIYAPALQNLYVGYVGVGSFKQKITDTTFFPTWASIQQEGIKLPQLNSERPFTVVASRSHNTPETEDYISVQRKIHPNLNCVSSGSSLKICLVAEGSADTYPRFAPTMEWDTAAGDAIARAAGKPVTQYPEFQKPLNYNKENLLNPWFLVS